MNCDTCGKALEGEIESEWGRCGHCAWLRSEPRGSDRQIMLEGNLERPVTLNIIMGFAAIMIVVCVVLLVMAATGGAG